MRDSQAMLWGGIFAAFGIALSGCSQFAQYQAWRPASADVDGIGTVAVGHFSGVQGSGPIGRSAVVSQLAAADHYRLVDLPPSAVPTGESPLVAAQRMGADALLKGHVVSYHVTDDVYQNQSLSVSEGNVDFDNSETVDREGTVTVSFELVDAHTGDIRAAHTASHTFRGQMLGGEVGMPARERVLQDLLHACATDITYMLAPHREWVPVRLAQPYWGTGAKQIRRGVSLAQRGQWDLAEAAWLAAWDADPQSDEALYNLAVASEARHDFVAAERYLHAALERNSSGLYAAGLQRLKENGPHHHLAVSQRQQRGEMGQRLATQGSSAPRISTAQSHVTPPVEAAPVSAAAPVEGTPLGVDVYVTPR